MRGLFNCAIIATILAGAGCSLTPTPTATSTPVVTPIIVTSTPMENSATPSQTASPPAYPTYPIPSIRCPYPPCWYTQTPFPSITFTPTPTPVAQPNEPLDRTSAESVLQWLNYALSEPDVTFFEKVALPTIYYGPAYSEPTGTYTREEFLEQIKQRISVKPWIVGYEDYPGVIHALFVTTHGWFPAWDFKDFSGKLVSNCVVFDFSDQWNKEEGLSLHGVYTTSCYGFMGTPLP